jgi:6-phosphogluconolactonase
VVANTDPNGVNPHERLTLTFTGIARARRIVVTVAGASKHDALARLMAGEDLPAGRLTGSDLVWLVDADALGDLTPWREQTDRHGDPSPKRADGSAPVR